MKIKQVALIAGIALCLDGGANAATSTTSATPTTPTPEQQCAYNGQDYQVAMQVEQKIQKALKANSVSDFATVLTYPLRVNVGSSKHYQVKSVKEMMIRYPTIMTPTMQQYILADDPKQIFCNDQGVMIGRGSIWFLAGKSGPSRFIINRISVQSSQS